MALNAQQKKGLAYLKTVLEKLDVHYEMEIADIFFKKQGEEVGKIFTDDLTVDDILEADPNEVYGNPAIRDAAQKAYEMWNPAPENTSYFCKIPNDDGEIALDQNGIKPLAVDGNALSEEDIARLSDLKENLSELLTTFRKEENGEYTAIKADLTDSKVWSGLMQKDPEGNYQPLVVDVSKFASEKNEDRLQALADMEKIIKGNNLYLRDEDGTISKVETAPNGKLFRGEYDRKSVQNIVQKEHTVVYGPVAMRIMQFFQSIGIHWFDGMIAEQEGAELQDAVEYERKIDNMKEERHKQIDEIMRENIKEVDIGREAMLPPAWDKDSAMANAMLNPETKLGAKIGRLKGPLHTSTLLGMLAGALSLENETEKAMWLLDGVTSGKKICEDPEMADYLQRGLERYTAAKKALENKDDLQAVAPMRALLGKAAGQIAAYAGNLVPLDNRAIMLSDITKELIQISKQTPRLKTAFFSDLQSVRGVLALGELVEDGLTAQYNLANNHTDPKEMQRDMGDYLAYKTAEQIMRVDAAYNAQEQIAKLTHEKHHSMLPDNAPTFLQILGRFGTKPFQNVFLHSDFGKNTLHTLSWEDVHEYKYLARDGFLNGNNSKIAEIARETAKELGKMYFEASPRAKGTKVTEYHRNPYMPEEENQLKGSQKTETMEPKYEKGERLMLGDQKLEDLKQAEPEVKAPEGGGMHI